MGYKFNPFTGNFDDAGASPGGSDTQVQVNDGGVFAGFIELLWNKITKVFTVKGDINLDDGGSFTTTLQTITPTANRTISLPDATGTVALVGGSSGQLLWNNAGANAGASTLTYDGSILTTSGRFINSYNATASSPAKAFTGTWFTGGTGTTTKPQVLIEPTGTTSTAWSTSGTGLGVNAASGFAGNLLDLQVNGSTIYTFPASGQSWKIGGLAASSAGNLTGGGYSGGNNIHTASGTLSLGGSVSPNAQGDVVLARDAANTLAQRNGTNAQVFRVYNTYTSSTNYELGKLEWNSNAFRIGTEKGSGGGTARALEFQTDGTTRATLKADGNFDYGPVSAALRANNPSGFAISGTSNGLFCSENTSPSGSFSGSFFLLSSNDGAAMAAGDRLGGLVFAGSSSAAAIRNATAIQGFANENWVDGTAYGGRLEFAVTPNGSTTRSTYLTLESTAATLADAVNIAVGATTGTKIGTATTQKLGFYNKTPVVQPAAVADATDAATAITQLNALLARMRDLGLIST